nr:hypothetical protein [uncultured bacterium]
MLLVCLFLAGCFTGAFHKHNFRKLKTEQEHTLGLMETRTVKSIFTTLQTSKKTLTALTNSKPYRLH